MNWRLKLLSGLIVGIFIAFALGYYKYFVAPKPPGVILFIVPGLNLDNLAATHQARLNLLTDSARAAFINNDDLETNPFHAQPNAIFSYLTTGYKTHADRIGLSTDGRVQDNLLYLAQRAGRTVGLVGTSSIATPELAAFYAHTKNPGDPTDLLQQLFDNTKINVILGGGADDFARTKEAADRDLFHEADLYGYQIARTDDELQNIPVWRLPTWRARRVLGVFAPRGLPFHAPPADAAGHGPHPDLTDLTRRAIQFLEFNISGYFLVIHDSLVADAIADGQPRQVTVEIEQLDLAIAEARELAGKNSVIILYSPYNVAAAGARPADLSFGWVLIYTDNDQPLRGVATGKHLFRYLRRQLDWKQF
ncbi:MAG: alkaline phosphatase [Verrucomicrobiales bacterium]|jgi:alkaline phosphatase|nr:alkaline phosphatase [Verrucomicrobiales bacterium]